ncbi:hypothetical protein THAOC_33710 [Thalassiosira oceanica]|uniref:Uncharacterized protein n=1 Tax=Thalassiosira oceanica TaxID=159749 RepID=K0REQ9_THAOC|nr:hypothetical protein THAOC_33710 [Thalassiosira oceanica]|eukprot:EJK47561.1 hypothetical protein THAOC_33710 [Thalassiosira oceanica]
MAGTDEEGECDGGAQPSVQAGFSGGDGVKYTTESTSILRRGSQRVRVAWSSSPAATYCGISRCRSRQVGRVRRGPPGDADVERFERSSGAAQKCLLNDLDLSIKDDLAMVRPNGRSSPDTTNFVEGKRLGSSQTPRTSTGRNSLAVITGCLRDEARRCGKGAGGGREVHHSGHATLAIRNGED